MAEVSVDTPGDNPGRARRFPLADGLRGFFLFNMAVVHISVWMPAVLPRLNHHSFGYVEDAQGFVFLSGFMVALVYGRLLNRRGPAALAPALRSRAATLFAHHAFLIAAVTLLAAVWGWRAAGSTIFAPFAGHPLAEAALSLGLLTGPDFIDILPMYILFILMALPAVRAMNRGHYPAVIAGSIGLWTLAQFHLGDLALEWLQQQTGLAAHGLEIGLYFDRLAWQMLFVAGMVPAMLHVQGRLDLAFLKQPRWRPVAVIAAGLFLLFGIVDIVHTWRLLPDRSLELLDHATDREHLSGLRVINFATDLFLLSWLLVAARDLPGRRWAPARAAGSALGRLFSWRPLVFLGQHSLTVYSWHVVLVYGFYALVDPRALPRALHEVIPLLAGLSLFVPAWIEARLRARRGGKGAPMPGGRPQPA